MGIFDRPQIPGQQPLPEPPGNDLVRQILMRRIMESSINPYGMSPEGASGINGPLFSTGLNPAPAFGMSSRGDMGDPNFRQSFLGGPQYPTGGGPRQMPPRATGAPMGRASSGSRVPLMAMGPSPQANGSSGSLLQMLLQLLGNSGAQTGGQSFYDGRRVARGRFYDGNSFSPLPDEDEQMGGARTVHKPAASSNQTQTPANRDQRNNGGNPWATIDWQNIYTRGGNSGQRGNTSSVGRTNWAGVTPWSGGFQNDSRGMAMGPGGVRYSGAGHEYSGGMGAGPGAEQFRSAAGRGQGGPSYNQWLRQINMQSVNNLGGFDPRSIARAAMLNRIPYDQYLAQIQGMGYQQAPPRTQEPSTPLPPPPSGPPPVPTTNNGSNQGAPY